MTPFGNSLIALHEVKLAIRYACLATWMLLLGIGPALADPSPEVRQQATHAQTLLAEGKQLIAQRKLSEAREKYTAARGAAERCVEKADASDPQTLLIIGPLRRRVAELHGALILEGLELDPLGPKLKPPAESPPKPPTRKIDPPARPQPPATPATPAKPSDVVSFRSQVAPLLVAHCVRCHTGAKPKGEFSVETFAALSNGAGGAAVIEPGKSGQSRLIEIIASGEMPKGKQKMPAAELAVLTRWIDQGAKFDGADREEALAKLAPATPPANPPAATPANPPPTTPMPAPPPGEPAFSTHVAPVLAAKCINCHGGRQPRNRLSMESFANLMRGGMTGRAITPGNGAGSLLIQKLKGTAKDGQRMPLDADPLPAAEIAAIEKWIAAGAKFDGPDPARPLAEVIALGAARGATHEELSRQRSAAAAKNWKLAIPDDASRSTTTDNFLVIGNVPQERLDAVATEAERLAPAIRTALGLPADKPLVRGRLTLYALAHRHDYTEFALMIEGRSKLPRGQVGHWRYTVADAYAAFVAPDEKPGATPAYGLPALLAEQIAAATVAARWQTPQWLANGIGKYLAATTAPADPRVAAWDERLKQLLADKPTAEDWLGGKLPHDDEIILGYGLARQMMSGGGAKMRSLAAALERQQPLDEALKKAYGRALAELAANWLGGAAPAKKGKK